MAKKRRPRARAGGKKPPKVKPWARVVSSALAHPIVGRDGRLLFKATIPPVLVPAAVQIRRPIPRKGRLVRGTALCMMAGDVLTLGDLVTIQNYIVRWL